MRIITTGGTFLKEYSPLTGSMGFGDDSKLEDLKGRFNLTYNIEVHRCYLKDSREIGVEDRQLLYEKAYELRDEPIVIIHGTDTMEHTARYLASRETGVIVMTGSWVPLSVKSSDAEFNLGFAIACAKLATSPGVYVAIDGEVFEANKVRKNWEKMIFEEIQ